MMCVSLLQQIQKEREKEITDDEAEEEEEEKEKKEVRTPMVTFWYAILPSPRLICTIGLM